VFLDTAFDYFEKTIRLMRAYFHPSTKKVREVISFICAILKQLCKRIKREKYIKSTKEEHKLQERDITRLLDVIIPAIDTSIFSVSQNHELYQIVKVKYFISFIHCVY
jgi:hypothetical protein